MDRQISDQLEKVLALVDSAHDFEAVVAVRKARQILSKTGIGFGDLAAAASRPRRAFGLFSSSTQLQSHALRQRQQLQELQAEMRAQTAQLEFWRGRAQELESRLNASHGQTENWQRRAYEVAEKLCDLGRQIGAEGNREAEPAKTTAGKG